MAGKYTLGELPAVQSEVTLDFEQIEGILKSRLPASAYEYRQWWENEKEGNPVNARAWANAGWIPKGMLREGGECRFQQEAGQADLCRPYLRRGFKDEKTPGYGAHSTAG